MANIKSAQKQARQAEAKKTLNLARRSAIKTAIKKVLAALENKTDEAKARELLNDVASKLYRARGKKVIHANTASRKLSRLTKQVNKAYQAEAAA
jgi:small subunit ribosomal protein S20